MKNFYSTVFVIFILLAANTGATNRPASYNQLQQTINATNSSFPINDMYKVRDRVKQNQQQYVNAREQQYKKMQEYENLYK